VTARRARLPTKSLSDSHRTLFAVLKEATFRLYRVHRAEISPGSDVSGPEFEIYTSLRSLRRTLLSDPSRPSRLHKIKFHEFNTAEDCLVWLKWSSGFPFVAAGYHPICAGANLKQRKEYIACVPVVLQVFLSTIVEGATVVHYIDSNRNWRSSNEFYVLALRYDPDYLASFFPSVPAGVVDEDCTGPFFWKEVTMDLPQSSKQHSSREGKKGKQRAHS